MPPGLHSSSETVRGAEPAARVATRTAEAPAPVAEIPLHGALSVGAYRLGTRSRILRFYHLLGVILASSGVALIAYAGVRAVVDQRMAAFYRDHNAEGGPLLFVLGLVGLVVGALAIVASDRFAKPATPQEDQARS